MTLVGLWFVECLFRLFGCCWFDLVLHGFSKLCLFVLGFAGLLGGCAGVLVVWLKLPYRCVLDWWRQVVFRG